MSKRSAMYKAKLLAPVALALSLAAGSTLATGATMPVGAEGAIEAEDRLAHVQAAINELPDADLKAFYLRCAREAVRGRLANGEIALCSIGYEELLQRTFKGNFLALLEWRKGRRRPEPLASPF